MEKIYLPWNLGGYLDDTEYEDERQATDVAVDDVISYYRGLYHSHTIEDLIQISHDEPDEFSFGCDEYEDEYGDDEWEHRSNFEYSGRSVYGHVEVKSDGLYVYIDEDAFNESDKPADYPRLYEFIPIANL